MMPTVSVLIPAYNAAPWIADAIRSAVYQDWAAIEVIVVDDGSTDDTYQIAYSFRGNNVVVIAQPNRGASAARNAAFAVSTGDYIQYLDADDLLATGKISAQLKLLQARSQRVLAACGWTSFTSRPNPSTSTRTALWRDFSNPVDWLVEAWLGGIWMPPSVWLTPRELISLAGPWDETLTLHDDGEFFSRVLLQSHGVRFCNEVLAFYRKGNASSLSTQRTPSSIRSHYRVCQLYEQHLLAAEHTARAKNACAANYQDFIFMHYPAHKAYLKVAAAQVARLGGTTRRRSASPKFRLLDRAVGWKMSKRVEDATYKYGITPSAIRRRWRRLDEDV